MSHLFRTWFALGAALAVWMAPPGALASDVVVVVDENQMGIAEEIGGGVTPSAVEPLWHLLVALRGARVDIAAGTVKDGCERLATSGASRLLVVRVRWSGWKNERLSRAIPVPKVSAEVRTGTRCARVRRLALGRHARAFVTRHEGRLGLVYSADRELHEALSDLLWRHDNAGAISIAESTLPEPRIVVPVRLVADDEYRRRYGDGWEAKVAERARIANHLLASTGLAIRVDGTAEWETPGSSDDPAAILGSLGDVRNVFPDDVLIGFTAQTSLERAALSDRTLGMAQRGGSIGFLVADGAIFRGDDPRWDALSEAMTLVHELFHHLGVGHAAEPGWLMSPMNSFTRKIRPEFVEQAVAAAELRFGPGATRDRIEAFFARDPPIDVARAELTWLEHHEPFGWRRPGCLGPRGNTAMAAAAWGAADGGELAPAERDAALIAAAAHARAAAAADPDLGADAMRMLDPSTASGQAIAEALGRMEWTLDDLDIAVECLDDPSASAE